MDMIQTLNELSAQRDTEQVAFFVHTESNCGPVTVDTNIPFPFENVNIGGGWKPTIYAFQAPVAGYYSLSASMVSNSGKHPQVGIVHTSESGIHTVASMYASGSSNNGQSKDAILYMQVDDYVSVQLRPANDGEVSSDHDRYTTFSGFLLYP